MSLRFQLADLAAVVASVVVGCSAPSVDSAPIPASEEEPLPPLANYAPSPSLPARHVEPAPELALSPEDVARFAPLPERPLAVPVLAFHSLCKDACADDDPYSIPRLVFARMMAMLGSAGYGTISIDAYQRFLLSDTAGLPPKPLLITFDDGRFDSWAGADAILEALGMRATMFVITDKPQLENDASFMRWSEIRAAAASGRWDVQLHANAGHMKVPVGMTSGSLVFGAAYASFRFDPMAPIDHRVESFEAWKARVESDIAQGEALLTANVLGHGAIAFAVPFGDIGQTSSDRRIENELRSHLDKRYAAWFVQPTKDPDFTTAYRGPSHEARRFVVGGPMTPEQLYFWLAKHATHPSAPPPVAPIDVPRVVREVR